MSKDSHHSPTGFASEYSSDKRVMGMGGGWGYGDPPGKYQRAPPRNLDAEAAKFLEKDYDEFVKEEPSLDMRLTAFDAFDQIYKAFGTLNRQEELAIKRKFGHTDILRHGRRLAAAFGHQGADRAKKGAKRKTASVAAGPQKPKAMKVFIANQQRVDSVTVRKYMRETTLNRAFKGTWVSEGMDKRVTNMGLAANHIEPPFDYERAQAEVRAEQWLKDQEFRTNHELTLVDPPLNMGKYFKDLCEANDQAYVAYKQLGVKETALLEIDRHKNKIALQREAELRGFPPGKMLELQRLLKKETEEAAYKLKFQ